MEAPIESTSNPKVEAPIESIQEVPAVQKKEVTHQNAPKEVKSILETLGIEEADIFEE